MRPQKYQKFPLLVESPRRGDSPDRFPKILGAFIRLTIQHKYFKFHVIRVKGYGVIARKPPVGKLGHIFSMHPVGKTIRWIEKWITPFMMGTTNSITMQSLGKIVQRAQAVGAKMWCLFVCFCYRQDAAKLQTAGIKFTHRPKIRFFGPQGRLVAPIHVKLRRTDGHVGPRGCAKFHLNRPRGWECGPQNIKKFHFLKRVAA